MTQISISECAVGEVVSAVTATASYWFVITGRQVAEIFRKGEKEQYAKLLEKRRLPDVITENMGFTMYNVDDQPVTAIVPHAIGKTTRDKIPMYHVADTLQLLL
jgi:hypothetical protein